MGKVIADLTARGWDVFIPFGRAKAADVVAVDKDNQFVPIEVRTAAITEGETRDTLYCYPKNRTCTVVAIVDNRDGAVYYRTPQFDGDDEEPEDTGRPDPGD